MAIATITTTVCIECEQTPIRPNKLRCDKCLPGVLDHLLDRYTPELDKMLATVTLNTRETT